MATKKVAIQGRDVEIFKFLDRVGYANIKHIARAVGEGEKSESTVLQRLYLLRRFGYLKTFTTHQGNYFGLDTKGRMNNALIFSIKLDQLLHHDFLIELYFLTVEKVNVTSERECIAEFKIVGKKGKIPDMVIDDWVIEFERTSKSVMDCKAVVEYWTVEQGRKLCVIYENEEIKNRYTALLNPRVRLLARTDYLSILQVLAIDSSTDLSATTVAAKPVPGAMSQPTAAPSPENAERSVIDEQYTSSVKNKYM